MDGNNSKLFFSLCINSSITSSNVSLVSSYSSSHLVENITMENSWYSQSSVCEETVFSIPVITGFRKPKANADRPLPVRQRIRRENKCVQALSLPSLLVYNMRSIWAKLDNFSDDMIERSANVSFLSEVWEKSESKKHKSKKLRKC